MLCSLRCLAAATMLCHTAAQAQPMFSAASSTLTAAAVGGTVTIGGTSYTITAIEPDTFGQTVLRLQEA